MFSALSLFLIFAATTVAAKTKGDAVHAAEVASANAATLDQRISNGEKIFMTNCAACHQATGKGLPGAFPPLVSSDYFAKDPMKAVHAVLNGLSGPITVNGIKYNAVMPNLSYISDSDVADVVTYVVNSFGNKGGDIKAAQVAAARGGDKVTGLSDHPVSAGTEMAYKGAPSAISAEDTKGFIDSEGPKMTQTEFNAATEIFFQRCAGCHGVLRKGATGKPLTTDITREKGTDYLKALITYGSGGGMPNWGTSDDLNEEQIDIMARFLQHEPPAPPEWGMPEMVNSWKLLVKPEDRPTQPQHDRNIDNFFAVTLRDAGQVAIIDGDTKFSQAIAVYDINNLDAGFEVLPIGEWADVGEGPKRVVQPEYNKAGDEAWFSVWNGLEQKSAIVIVDDKTRKLKKVLKGPEFVTPTGKFNIYNTVHDIY